MVQGRPNDVVYAAWRMYRGVMDISHVEMKLLENLVALVEEASVTRAAERMELSQPRMSNALRKLRQICGDPLLVRVGQQFIPTERAIDIAGRVRLGLAQIGGALQAPDAFDPSTSHRSFVVMMSDYTAALLLPEVMRRVSKVAPAIEISMLPMSHNLLQQGLDSGSCDLAFGYFKRLHPNLRLSNCFQDNAVCVAGPEFKGSGSSISMRAFLSARHVCMGDATDSTSTIDVMCDQTLRKLGLSRKISVRCPTPMTVARIVSRTELIGMLPMRLARDYATSLGLRCLHPPFELPPFDVSMVWHERVQQNLAHAWLREQFRRTSAEMAMARMADQLSG